MKQNKPLAIIPARSGSKGLKNKNILHLSGEPLIAHTIKAAINSGVFSDVLVSTDSEEYKAVSESFGAWVPFIREDNISGDKATATEVITDVLDRLKNTGKTYDAFAFLQPTSPLRNEKHIREAFDLFYKKKANAVVSITKAEHSPLWCNTVGEDLRIDNFIKPINNLRQALPDYYRLNGAIYISNTEYFLKYKNFYHSVSYGYIMDDIHSVDIDNIFDFKFAEFLIKEIQEGSI